MDTKTLEHKKAELLAKQTEASRQFQALQRSLKQLQDEMIERSGAIKLVDELLKAVEQPSE